MVGDGRWWVWGVGCGVWGVLPAQSLGHVSRWLLPALLLASALAVLLSQPPVHVGLEPAWSLTPTVPFVEPVGEARPLFAAGAGVSGMTAGGAALVVLAVREPPCLVAFAVAAAGQDLAPGGPLPGSVCGSESSSGGPAAVRGPTGCGCLVTEAPQWTSSGLWAVARVGSLSTLQAAGGVVSARGRRPVALALAPAAGAPGGGDDNSGSGGALVAVLLEDYSLLCVRAASGRLWVLWETNAHHGVMDAAGVVGSGVVFRYDALLFPSVQLPLPCVPCPSPLPHLSNPTHALFPPPAPHAPARPVTHLAARRSCISWTPGPAAPWWWWG